MVLLEISQQVHEVAANVVQIVLTTKQGERMSEEQKLVLPPNDEELLGNEVPKVRIPLLENKVADLAEMHRIGCRLRHKMGYSFLAQPGPIEVHSQHLLIAQEKEPPARVLSNAGLERKALFIEEEKELDRFGIQAAPAIYRVIQIGDVVEDPLCAELSCKLFQIATG